MGKEKRRRRSRQTRRAEATRSRILTAARTVFSEKGLDLTGIEDITERADVGKGTFYYHFESKEAVINVLVEEMLSGLVALIDENCAESRDLYDLLDKLIGAHIAFFSNRWEDFVLFFQGRSDLALTEGYSGMETPFLGYLERIEALIASVLKAHLPQTVLRRIACAVAGFVSGYYGFAAVASAEEDVDQAFRALRGAMVAGLVRFVQETQSLEKREKEKIENERSADHGGENQGDG